jgi:hypothetical protein
LSGKFTAGGVGLRIYERERERERERENTYRAKLGCLAGKSAVAVWYVFIDDDTTRD